MAGCGGLIAVLAVRIVGIVDQSWACGLPPETPLVITGSPLNEADLSLVRKGTKTDNNVIALNTAGDYIFFSPSLRLWCMEIHSESSSVTVCGSKQIKQAFYPGKTDQELAHVDIPPILLTSKNGNGKKVAGVIILPQREEGAVIIKPIQGERRKKDGPFGQMIDDVTLDQDAPYLRITSEEYFAEQGKKLRNMEAELIGGNRGRDIRGRLKMVTSEKVLQTRGVPPTVDLSQRMDYTVTAGPCGSHVSAQPLSETPGGGANPPSGARASKP